MKTLVTFLFVICLFSPNFAQIIEPIEDDNNREYQKSNYSTDNEEISPQLVGEAGSGWIYFGIHKSTVSSMFHGADKNKTNLVLDSLLPDHQPPIIQIISPEIGRGFKLITQDNETKIVAKITDDSEVFEVKFNNQEVVANSDGLYIKTIQLSDHENIITIKAKDIYENISEKQIVINKDKIEIRENAPMKMQQKTQQVVPSSGNNSLSPLIKNESTANINNYNPTDYNKNIIKWLSPQYSNISTSKQKYRVKAGIDIENINEIRLFVNNKLISNRLTENEDPLVKSKFIINELVDLQFGKNTVRIEVERGEIDCIDEIIITNNSISDNYCALIIGINDYQDEKITDLNEPLTDIENLGKILTTEYNFNPNKVKILKNPNKTLIISTLHELRGSISPSDNLLIFYAGHGTWDQEMNTGYWLPSDANSSNPVNWIPNTELTNYINAIKSQHTLLIADACFSGSIFKTRNLTSENQAAIEKLYGLKSRKAITSGTMKQEVPDKSTFTHFLIKKLEDNQEKYLTAEQLFLSLRLAVLNNSANIPQYGTIQNTGDEGGEFIFIKKE